MKEILKSIPVQLKERVFSPLGWKGVCLGTAVIALPLLGYAIPAYILYDLESSNDVSRKTIDELREKIESFESEHYYLIKGHEIFEETKNTIYYIMLAVYLISYRNEIRQECIDRFVHNLNTLLNLQNSLIGLQNSTVNLLSRFLRFIY